MISPSARVPIGSIDGKSVPMDQEWMHYLTVTLPAALGLQVYTVATLPVATGFSRAFVSDATATTFNSVVAGTGANRVPVFSDGTNWRIG